MRAVIYQADVYCFECIEGMGLIPMPDSHEYDSGEVPKDCELGAADYPMHCAVCGLFLENELTEDGQTYLRDLICDPRLHPEVRREYTDYYGKEAGNGEG